MELLQLKYFCHAAGCENFSKTEEYFDVPTSNISRAVRALETELGVKLFRRTANKLTLNEQGRAFYSHIKRSLAEIEMAKQSVCDDNDSPKGGLRLLISSCRRIVTQAIEVCQKRYPDIKFNVKHGVTDGEYDIIISDTPPSKGEHGKYAKKELMTERMLLAVPKSSPLCGSTDMIHNLESEKFISLGEGTRLHALTLQICRSLGFEPDISIQIDDPYYMRKYLEMGLGVAFFPERSWANLVPEGVELFDIGVPLRRMYAFCETDSVQTHAQKVFLGILEEIFAES